MADSARSPDATNLAEPDSLSGDVTSAILPVDQQPPDSLDDDEDDDDDIPRSRPRGDKVNADLNDDEASNLGDDDDLFGEGGDADEEEQPQQHRALDDDELDSGDDEGRRDRVASEAPAEETQNVVVQESSMSRQPLPEPSDGEVYLTKVPKFLTIDPHAWHHTTYQPPTADHHSNEAAPGFSAYNTALSTVHWRHSPSDPAELQSNARILRWSDGSLTLQLASNPTQQYEIEGNPLAPRQRNPVIPTPTSFKPNKREHGNHSYTYLTAPDASNGLLRVTHKVTAGLSILPSAATTDDALEKLQNSLAAIAHGKNKSTAGGIEVVKIDEDPELAKKKAEVAEREKERARKRREAAENRERERSGRALGRAGLGSSRYGGGLTAGMLEDDELGGGGRQRARPKPRRQRRNSEYSEDEDFGRKRGNFGHDEYDEEDDFIAGSDEEEIVEEEEDEDDGIVEDRRPKAPAKRPSPDDEDDDAEGEVDDIPQASRAKRRRVIDEDDDDE